MHCFSVFSHAHGIFIGVPLIDNRSACIQHISRIHPAVILWRHETYGVLYESVVCLPKSFRIISVSTFKVLRPFKFLPTLFLVRTSMQLYNDHFCFKKAIIALLKFMRNLILGSHDNLLGLSTIV